jgi:hypothetical protein
MAGENLEKRIEDLEKQLSVLQDIEAIKTLHREYVYGLIMHRWEEMGECFTDSASATIAEIPTRHGKNEIISLLKEIIGPHLAWDLAHWVTQPVITVRGDTASGHWLLYLLTPGPPVNWKQARYDCEYVKEDGRWKFKELVFRSPWPVPQSEI